MSLDKIILARDWIVSAKVEPVMPGCVIEATTWNGCQILDQRTWSGSIGYVNGKSALVY